MNCFTPPTVKGQGRPNCVCKSFYFALQNSRNYLAKDSNNLQNLLRKADRGPPKRIHHMAFEQACPPAIPTVYVEYRERKCVG